jgi:hypothetical protein
LSRNRVAEAPTARCFTPRSASGINTMMISALKITADRMALFGVARRMMFSLSSTG